MLRFMKIIIIFIFLGNDNSNDKNYEIINANAVCEYMIILNVLIVSYFFKKSRFQKKLFRNATRAPNSLDPDQVPYFVGPELGKK